MLKDTGYTDLYGNRIFVGNVLYCKWGYFVEVVEEDGEFVGKLICESGDSCENIPYSLMPSEDFIIVTASLYLFKYQYGEIK